MEKIENTPSSARITMCVATGLYPPDIGGPATHTVFLEKHATRLGLDLTVVPFSRVRRFPLFIRHILYFFMLLMKGRKAELLYALDTISVGVPAMLACAILRKPLMLRVPGDYAWEQGQQRYGIAETLDAFRLHSKHPIGVRVLRTLQAIVARYAEIVIVPSEYMKGVVEGWGVPADRIVRVYSVLNAVDSRTTSPREDATFTITTAGRLVPWKGYNALIDVVGVLHREGIPVVLHIIGDGVCRGELETKVQSENLGEVVQFHGVLDREDMAERIKKSDVFILNTSYEGLSHQLLEVMSLGVPIVTTPVGGNPEIITHEETGLFVSWNNREEMREAILRLRDDEALRARIRDRALGSLEKFTEEHIIEEFDALFKTI